VIAVARLFVLICCAAAAPVVTAQHALSPRQVALQAYASAEFEACTKIYDQELGRSILSIPITEIDAASCYASAGREEDALHALERSVQHPAFSTVNLKAFQSRPELARLSEHASWTSLMTSARKKSAAEELFLGAGVDLAYARKHPARISHTSKSLGRGETVLLVWVPRMVPPARLNWKKAAGRTSTTASPSKPQNVGNIWRRNSTARPTRIPCEYLFCSELDSNRKSSDLSADGRVLPDLRHLQLFCTLINLE
jgi:hypothetical protein